MTRDSHVSCLIRPSGAGPVRVLVKRTHRLWIEPDMLHQWLHLIYIENLITRIYCKESVQVNLPS